MDGVTRTGNSSAPTLDAPSAPGASPSTADGALIPEPALGAFPGDLYATVCALLITSSNHERAQARAAADAAERARVAATQQRVAKMREKADEVASEGLTRGWSQVVSGSLVAASAFCQPAEKGLENSAEKASYFAKPGGEPPPPPAKGGSTDWSRFLPGAADGVAGVGELLAAGHASAQVSLDADAEAADNRAESAKAQRDSSADVAAEASERVKRVLRFIAEFEATRNATSLLAARA